MNSYQEIDRLLGTPLNQIPKPKIPFKWTVGKIAVVGGVVVLAFYGAYTLCKDVKSVFRKKDDSDDDAPKSSGVKFKNSNEKSTGVKRK